MIKQLNIKVFMNRQSIVGHNMLNNKVKEEIDKTIENNDKLKRIIYEIHLGGINADYLEASIITILAGQDKLANANKVEKELQKIRGELEALELTLKDEENNIEVAR